MPKHKQNAKTEGADDKINQEQLSSCDESNNSCDHHRDEEEVMVIEDVPTFEEK
tara:strand:+ start:868 stop:1029 length:162 start_codon:yes stop_codon:yes gene_type:complete